MKAHIQPLNQDDIDQAEKLIAKVIPDSFVKEGLCSPEYRKVIAEEIERVKNKFTVE